MPDGTPALGERLLRLPDVEEKTSLSRSTIYRRIQAGTFPAPLELGPGTVRWRMSDVDAWIEGLSAARQ
jgi:prophage regulatory protein